MKKYHWYLVNLSENSEDHVLQTSVFLYNDEMRVTRYNLLNARYIAGMSEDATCVSVSYLGYMSIEEFNYES